MTTTEAALIALESLVNTLSTAVVQIEKQLTEDSGAAHLAALEAMEACDTAYSKVILGSNLRLLMQEPRFLDLMHERSTIMDRALVIFRQSRPVNGIITRG